MRNTIFYLGIICFFFACTPVLDVNTSTNETLNGSYATMLTVGDFLYAINKEELTTFNIEDRQNPVELDKQDVGFNVENIYHNMGVLFIGSQEALHIFEIAADGIPERKSQTSYEFDQIVLPCDPVIANDTHAFVTLSTTIESEGGCQRWEQINQLRIYDITDLENPILESVSDIQTPKGLALAGQYLFVCSQNFGVNVLDVNDPTNPLIINQLTGFDAYDVIAKDGLLMVVGPTEIRQFDYTDINDIIYLSSIDL